MKQSLVPLPSAALLGFFRGALDSALVERGAAQGLELLGRPEEFWARLAPLELRRMAAGGNAGAQAELAWRHVNGDREQTDAAAAVRWALQSAESDCPSGLAVLAWLLHHGWGLPRDDTEALRLFTRAAASEVVLALYWLGRMHYFGIGVGATPDFARAGHWLRRAAGHGHAASRDLLARCHFFGRGVAQNREEALRLWRAAAADGIASASFCLGMCLYVGEGIAADPAAAVVHFRAAAEQGVAGAMFLLGQAACFGIGAVRNPDAALEWYGRAAQRGSRDAEFELGECHAYGIAAAGRDLGAALHWWRAAAQHGHVRAHLKIAHAYRWGDGIAEDKATALTWYRAAADLGDAAAWVWLGECHERGEGTAVDHAAARRAYCQAAACGDAHGMAEHGRCLLLGIGGEIEADRGEALLLAAMQAGWPQARGELVRYWYERGRELLESATVATDPALAVAVSCLRRAAARGHRRAAFMLAECLRHGTGVAADAAAAVDWYRRAATLPDAKLILGDLLYFGQGVARRPAEAFHWYQQAALQHEDAYAMYSCGYCLLHGEGVERDAQRGVYWLRRSALQDEAGACFELGLAYQRGAGVRRSSRQAAKWLRSAAGLGHAEARALLLQLEGAA